MAHTSTSRANGPISWMIANRVTPNLLMVFLILGGFFMTTKIKQEVFPEFALDQVNIEVSYPGSSPEEVERGIILAIEDAIEGIEGVKEITSTASEGGGGVYVEVLENADPQTVLQDIEQEVDRVEPRVFIEGVENFQRRDRGSSRIRARPLAGLDLAEAPFLRNLGTEKGK